MQWFPRTRATIRRRVWQYNYARRVMERTTYSFHEAIQQAVATQNIYADDWHKWNEAQTADMRIELTCPPERMRK